MPDGPVVPQWSRGTAARQAHVSLPAGTVEEEHGRDGFAGPASHLYRLHPPTGWTSVEGPLRPHAIDAGRLAGSGDDADAADLPVALLENGQVRISFWCRPSGTPDWFFRDADGDLLYFVHRGEGTLETEYGPLPLRPGDYLLVPRGTTHRVAAEAPVQLLVVEALEGRVGLPDRGLLGRHALFDPAVIEVPEPEPVEADGEFEVRVLRADAVTRIRYPFHP
ncbi:MAG TPA: homogentisate 1,2-dioxygenase, partial [Acidimicrobiales bacterium]|nr:homogentisate 1,2-dioxygenase [Acidimicrobiales bacterium]